MHSKTQAIAFMASIALSSLLGSNAHAISWTQRSWTLQHDPDKFAHDVAAACLTTASSKIETQGKEIMIQDSRLCGDEIKKLSQEWDKDPSVPMVSVSTRRRPEDRMRAALSEQFSKQSEDAKADELKIFPEESEHKRCPCLVLSGSKAVEAKNFLVEKFGSAKHGITPLKFKLPKPNVSATSPAQ
jgi:hypothetical protein